MKKFFTLVLIFSFMTGAVVSADEIDDLEEEKAAYEIEAEEALRRAEALQIEIESVSEYKRQLDEEAAVAVADYEEKQAVLDETLYRIEENEILLRGVEKDYREKHKVLEKRVRDIYINGQISYVDVVFGAQDFSDLLTRMDLLKRVIVQDSALVNSVLQYKGEIEEIGRTLEADRKIQAELAAKAEEAKELQLEKVAEQQALLERMENDKALFDQQYDEKMAASKEVERLIQQSKYKSNGFFTGGNGSMIWPVTGPITSPFGWRTHPIFGSQIFHSGLDIAEDYGVPVHAAQSGVVITAGWVGGYGNTVMIDHGGGVVTLYGHNQSLAVGVGDAVNQGDVISYVGSTGNSTGPHCHFEVRVNGEPVSPLDYL